MIIDNFSNSEPAAVEAAAHYARTGNTAFAGYVVEEVKLLAAHLVVFRQTVVGGIHALAHCFIIAGHESVANGKFTR